MQIGSTTAASQPLEVASCAVDNLGDPQEHPWLHVPPPPPSPTSSSSLSQRLRVSASHDLSISASSPLQGLHRFTRVLSPGLPRPFHTGRPNYRLSFLKVPSARLSEQTLLPTDPVPSPPGSNVLSCLKVAEGKDQAPLQVAVMPPVRVPLSLSPRAGAADIPDHAPGAFASGLPGAGMLSPPGKPSVTPARAPALLANAASGEALLTTRPPPRFCKSPPRPTAPRVPSAWLGGPSRLCVFEDDDYASYFFIPNTQRNLALGGCSIKDRSV